MSPYWYVLLGVIITAAVVYWRHVAGGRGKP